MTKGEQPPDDEKLQRAEQAGADAVDEFWKETAELDEYFNVEVLRKEQIPAIAEAYRAQSQGDYEALTKRSPEVQSRAAEYWNEIGTAFRDIQTATTDEEARRSLKVILFNHAKLARLRSGE